MDGQTPYAELRDIGFANTGINKYDNLTAGDEEPLRIYLTQGVHIITLKVTAGPLDGPYHRLLEVIGDINETGLLLSRIRGNSSGSSASVDANRTWDVFPVYARHPGEDRELDRCAQLYIQRAW